MTVMFVAGVTIGFLLARVLSIQDVHRVLTRLRNRWRVYELRYTEAADKAKDSQDMLTEATQRLLADASRNFLADIERLDKPFRIL